MPLPPNPTVQLFFTGLLTMYYNEPRRRFEIGALQNADHLLRIGIGDGPPENVDLSTFKLLTYDRSLTGAGIEVINSLSLSLDVLPSSLGATRYLPDGPVQTEPPNYPDDQDFRWGMRLDGVGFHNTTLPPVGPLSPYHPIMFINDGLFYTQRKVDVKKIQGFRPQVMTTVAWYMGANIYLTQGQTAVFSWGTGSKAMSYGGHYSIFVSNICNQSSGCTDSDLHHYYDGVASGTVAIDDQFELEGLPGCTDPTFLPESVFSRVYNPRDRSDKNILTTCAQPCDPNCPNGTPWEQPINP